MYISSASLCFCLLRVLVCKFYVYMRSIIIATVDHAEEVAGEESKVRFHTLSHGFLAFVG